MILDQSSSGFSSSFEDMKFMVNLWKVLKENENATWMPSNVRLNPDNEPLRLVYLSEN